MASFWDNQGLSIFSDHCEDYEVAREVAPEEEDEGFVCLSPMSEDSESETFIDDEYDICDDAIEEIRMLKAEQEHFEQNGAKEEEEAEDDNLDTPTFKVPDDELVRRVDQAAIKRRRPEVDSPQSKEFSSTPSVTLTSEPSNKRLKIGEGTFGKVYKLEEGGKVFAVKEISVSDPKAEKEQRMLETVKHKHIIHYFRAFVEDNRLNIVMEFADLGSLTQIVREADREPGRERLFKEHNLWRFLHQMSSALNYLHEHKPRRIMHRDLKVAFGRIF